MCPEFANVLTISAKANTLFARWAEFEQRRVMRKFVKPNLVNSRVKPSLREGMKRIERERDRQKSDGYC